MEELFGLQIHCKNIFWNLRSLEAFSLRASSTRGMVKAAVFPQHTAHTIVAAEKKEKCTTWLSSQSNKMEKGNRRRKSGMENSFPREKVFLYFCCEAQNADFSPTKWDGAARRYAWCSRRSIKAVRVGWMETFAAPFSLFLSRLRTERGEQQQKEEKPPLGLGWKLL